MHEVIPTVGALVPPVLPQRDHPATGACAGTLRSRHPLPLATLRARRTSSPVYGLAALDCHGRVADRIIQQALGWSAGLRLVIADHRDASPHSYPRGEDARAGVCPGCVSRTLKEAVV